MSLILDGRIAGKVDQVNGIIVLDRLCVSLSTPRPAPDRLPPRPVTTPTNSSKTESSARYKALDTLAGELQALSARIVRDKFDRELRPWPGAHAPGIEGFA